MRFSRYGSKHIYKGVAWKPCEFVQAAIENTWQNEGFLRIQQSKTEASDGNPCDADKLLRKQGNR